ncbi:MAG TPA: hypothetical protein VFS91_04205 [Nitrobacter sp.]|nr:hypothetical protein [Nitrobacter sp.]
MKFRFIGKYTGDRDSISILGHHFQGRQATDVEDEEIAARFQRHPEFEEAKGKYKGSLDDEPEAEEAA